MKVKYTFPVEDLRGKSGGNSGLVASAWRGIKVMRTFVLPANPNSEDQVQVRTFFSAATKAWSDVTPTEYEMWNNLAKLKPIMVMGSPVIVSAFDMFVKTNVYRLIAGLNISLIAPEHYYMDGVVLELKEPKVDLDQDTLQFVLTTSGFDVPNDYIGVYMTPLLSSQNIVVKDNDFRLISGADPANLSIRPAVATETLITFDNIRTVPNLTQYFWIKIIPFNEEMVAGSVFYAKVLCTEA